MLGLSPVNRFLPRRYQVIVCFAKVLIAKEAAIGGEGRGMGRLQHQILRRVDECPFLLRV